VWLDDKYLIGHPDNPRPLRIIRRYLNRVRAAHDQAVLIMVKGPMAPDWKAFNGIIESMIDVFIGLMINYADEVSRFKTQTDCPALCRCM
jgi:hypothetical protein